MTRTDRITRFLEHIERDGGHHMWCGSFHRGVPVLGFKRVGGRRQIRTFATRFAVELATGRRPPRGHLVLRSCGETRCVRAEHLLVLPESKAWAWIAARAHAARRARPAALTASTR